MNELAYDNLLNEFPFLSVIRYGNNEFVGIIQNEDINITSVYLLEKIKNTKDKSEFIKYGREWWWETNRQIPINIVLGSKFDKFDYCLVSFSNKNVEIIHGPTVRIRDLLRFKSKKKNVQLVRKID